MTSSYILQSSRQNNVAIVITYAIHSIVLYIYVDWLENSAYHIAIDIHMDMEHTWPGADTCISSD